jgi:hypothetical protein
MALSGAEKQRRYRARKKAELMARVSTVPAMLPESTLASTDQEPTTDEALYREYLNSLRKPDVH